MLSRGFLLQLAVTISSTLVALFLQWRGFEPLARSEIFIHDAIARIGRKAPANKDLVYLAIDNDSITLDPVDLQQFFDLSKADAGSASALRMMSSGWPWPRAVYASILDRLFKAGAKVVAFDLIFPTATADDAAFRAALDKFRGSVVIGCNFVDTTVQGMVSQAPQLSRPCETIISQRSPLDARVGYVNFWPDFDDVVRGARPSTTFESVTGNKETYESFTERIVEKSGLPHAGMGDTQSHLIRFTGKPGTFPARPAFEIFVPEYWNKNYGGGDFFRGKVVVVGAFGNWQHDEHETPFGKMPGPELQINVLNALIHNEFIQEPTGLQEWCFVAAGGILSWLAWRCIRRPAPRFMAAAVITLLWLGADFEIYNHASTYILAFTPLLLLNINTALSLAYDVTSERRERQRVRLTLERYVSKNVVKELLDFPADYVHSLGGVAKPVTILFSDIRNFTQFTSTHQPHEVVAQLNEYLSGMVSCVFEHDGTLDKFMGDAVMAVWGNARSAGAEADAAQAVRAALAMRSRLAELNKRWRAEGRATLRIGIALNHGTVIVGNVGSEQRMEFTVIGAAVNVGWRLQELTKRLGADLLIGESVEQLTRKEFTMEQITTFTPDAETKPFHVFGIERGPRGGASAPMPDHAAAQARQDALCLAEMPAVN